MSIILVRLLESFNTLLKEIMYKTGHWQSLCISKVNPKKVWRLNNSVSGTNTATKVGHKAERFTDERTDKLLIITHQYVLADFNSVYIIIVYVDEWFSTWSFCNNAELNTIFCWYSHYSKFSFLLQHWVIRHQRIYLILSSPSLSLLMDQ